jgi:hypothetical protein
LELKHGSCAKDVIILIILTVLRDSSGNSPVFKMLEDYHMIILRFLVAGVKNEAQKPEQKRSEGREEKSGQRSTFGKLKSGRPEVRGECKGQSMKCKLRCRRLAPDGSLRLALTNDCLAHAVGFRDVREKAAPLIAGDFRGRFWPFCQGRS